MLQVITTPLIALQLHVAPVQVPTRIVVGPQIQGSPITAVQALQPTLHVEMYQNAAKVYQAPTDSLKALQNASGAGQDGYTLQ